MTLADLIVQFRNETADLAAPYLWSDDYLTLLAAEAEEEAAVRKRLIRDSTSAFCQIAVLKGVSVYALDPRIVEVVYAAMVFTGSANMFPYRLAIETEEALDKVRPAWRTLIMRPTAIIHHDNDLRVDCVPDTTYTINTEVYRLPLNPMANPSDTPEINGVHHRHLVKWMKHRAYGKQDADTQDLDKSEKYRLEFEEKFGPPVDASYRKNVNASKPHRNRLW